MSPYFTNAYQRAGWLALKQGSFSGTTKALVTPPSRRGAYAAGAGKFRSARNSAISSFARHAFGVLKRIRTKGSAQRRPLIRKYFFFKCCLFVHLHEKEVLLVL